LEDLPFDLYRDEAKFNAYHENLCKVYNVKYYGQEFLSLVLNCLQHNPDKRMSSKDIPIMKNP
jgi:hypothetical protein